MRFRIERLFYSRYYFYHPRVYAKLQLYVSNSFLLYLSCNLYVCEMYRIYLFVMMR